LQAESGKRKREGRESLYKIRALLFFYKNFLRLLKIIEHNYRQILSTKTQNLILQIKLAALEM